jgi:general secretion pathway protein G
MNGLRLRMNASAAQRNRGTLCSKRGFTLIELMIQRSREAVLRHDLLIMREAIDNFTLDKQAAPQSLEDIQQAGYLREVPMDPITQAKDWAPVFDNIVLSPDQVTTGMVDVHSNSGLTSRFDGTAYNTW